MEFTAAEEPYQERLVGLILAVKTLAEIAATKQALQEWVPAHPDDLWITDGFDHLVMSHSLAESRGTVQQQSA